MESLEFKYNDGGRKDSGYKGNAGDCVCRSIAIISGLPYKEVYDRLAIGNATQRKGKYESKTKAGVKTASKGINTKRKWFSDYMTELGFEWTPTMEIGKGCQVHLRKDELPTGNIIVFVLRILFVH
jgi:hypothetical protein